MPRTATKAASNVFYKARINASSYNDRLASREGASEITGIDRNRIAYTELGTQTPYPEEVLIYADVYNAPELPNYYCTHECPIGKETMDQLKLSSLERTSLKLLSSIRSCQGLRDSLVEIAKDGKITEDERPQMEEILDKMHQLSNDISLMEIVCKKLLNGE